MNRYPVAVSVALLTLGAGGLAARSSAPPPAPARAEATVGSDWLDVRFPRITLANSGCGDTDLLPSGVRQRWYQWRVTADFPDRNYPNNHFMGVYVFFGLPDSLPLTDLRLDSAIAATPITVDEAMGEPPMTATQVKPERVWARRESGRLHLHVEGRKAVEAFLRARTDSVDVGWCQRDEALTYLRIALKRR